MVEVTTDGGRSWSKTKPGLTAIVRLKAYGDDSVFAIGADDRCRPTYAWITGPTKKWQRDRSQVDANWYRSPDDLDEVHAPSGRRTKPCGDALVDFAGLGKSEAAVLCADGRIRTAAGIRSWKTLQTRSNVLSLSADDSRFGSAGTRDECSGVVVRRFNSKGDGLTASGSCRSDVKAEDGATALSVHDQQVWIWSGARISRY